MVSDERSWSRGWQPSWVSASRWSWQRRANVRDDMPACKANSRFVIFDLYFPIIILNDFLSYKYTKKMAKCKS